MRIEEVLLLSDEERELGEVLEGDAGAAGNGAQGVLSGHEYLALGVEQYARQSSPQYIADGAAAPHARQSVSPHVHVEQGDEIHEVLGKLLVLGDAFKERR